MDGKDLQRLRQAGRDWRAALRKIEGEFRAIRHLLRPDDAEQVADHLTRLRNLLGRLAGE